MHYIELQISGVRPMETQLTLRMPADLATRLERVAKRTRRKRSEVARLALEQFLNQADLGTQRRPIDLARDLLGSVESGIPDFGRRHRDYLLRRLRRAR